MFSTSKAFFCFSKSSLAFLRSYKTRIGLSFYLQSAIRLENTILNTLTYINLSLLIGDFSLSLQEKWSSLQRVFSAFKQQKIWVFRINQTRLFFKFRGPGSIFLKNLQGWSVPDDLRNGIPYCGTPNHVSRFVGTQ